MRKKKAKKRDNKCDRCGGELDIYYGEWCPVCDKPKVYTVEALNLIKCKQHLQAIGRDKLAKQLQQWLDDSDIRNDNMTTFFREDKEEDEGLSEGIWEVFELGDRTHIEFYISW